MISKKFNIPFLIRWKFSKEKIKREFQNKTTPCKICKLEELQNFYYGTVVTETEDKEIFIGLITLMKNPILINSSFKISLSPSNNSYEFIEKTFGANYEKWGISLCSYGEFFDPANNYFIDDFIYITIEGILNFEKESNQQIDAIIEIKTVNNLGELLYNRDDKDFEIYSNDGKFIKVHKLILSAKSVVFDKMIHSGLKESTENKVFITDFDYETIEIAIKYFYGIEIANSLNCSVGIKILKFCDKYDITDLKASMETYLFNQKSSINICEIVNASIISNSIKLREQCFDFMLQCMKESTFIKDLEVLDKEFALNLLKASFCLNV